MGKRTYLFFVGLLAGLILLSACGNLLKELTENLDTDDQAATGKQFLIQGFATNGYPIVGNVTLKDVSGVTIGPQRISWNGKFSFNVGNLNGPFILAATDSAGKSHYGIAYRPLNMGKTNISVCHLNVVQSLVTRVVFNTKDVDVVFEKVGKQSAGGISNKETIRLANLEQSVLVEVAGVVLEKVIGGGINYGVFCSDLDYIPIISNYTQYASISNIVLQAISDDASKLGQDTLTFLVSILDYPSSIPLLSRASFQVDIASQRVLYGDYKSRLSLSTAAAEQVNPIGMLNKDVQDRIAALTTQFLNVAKQVVTQMDDSVAKTAERLSDVQNVLVGFGEAVKTRIKQNYEKTNKVISSAELVAETSFMEKVALTPIVNIYKDLKTKTTNNNASVLKLGSKQIGLVTGKRTSSLKADANVKDNAVAAIGQRLEENMNAFVDTLSTQLNQIVAPESAITDVDKDDSSENEVAPENVVDEVKLMSLFNSVETALEVVDQQLEDDFEKTIQQEESLQSLYIGGPPSSPSDISFDTNNLDITITWTDPTADDLALVVIRRGTDKAPAMYDKGENVIDSAEAITTLADGQKQIVNTNLTSSTQYYYAFFAIDTDGQVSDPATASVRTRPTPPTQLAGQVSDQQVSLIWRNPSEASFVKVDIRRSSEAFALTPTQATSIDFEEDVVVEADVSYAIFVDQSLTNGTTYYYSLFAMDTDQGYSKPVTISMVPANTATPNKCPYFSAQAGDSQVTLIWAPPSDSDFASVDIYRSTDATQQGDKLTFAASDVIESGDYLMLLQQSLTNGLAYYFSIFAKDTAGNVSDAKTATVTPADTTAPTSPTSFTATEGDASVSLTWSNPASYTAQNTDFAGVKIYRSTVDFPASVSDGTYVYGGMGTSFADNGVSNGTTYYYSIFAFDEVPNYSAAANASAQPADPNAGQPDDDTPPDTTISGGDDDWHNSDVTLTLTPSDDNGGTIQTYYRIADGEQQNGTIVVVSAEGQNSITYWSVDAAGNTEQQKSFQYVKIDKTDPSQVENISALITDGGDPWVKLDNVLVTWNIQGDDIVGANLYRSISSSGPWDDSTKVLYLEPDSATTVNQQEEPEPEPEPEPEFEIEPVPGDEDYTPPGYDPAPQGMMYTYEAPEGYDYEGNGWIFEPFLDLYAPPFDFNYDGMVWSLIEVPDFGPDPEQGDPDPEQDQPDAQYIYSFHYDETDALVDGETYYYKVKLVDRAGNVGEGDIGNVNALYDFTAPVVTSFTISPNAETIYEPQDVEVRVAVANVDAEIETGLYVRVNFCGDTKFYVLVDDGEQDDGIANNGIYGKNFSFTGSDFDGYSAENIIEMTSSIYIRDDGYNVTTQDGPSFSFNRTPFVGPTEIAITNYPEGVNISTTPVPTINITWTAATAQISSYSIAIWRPHEDWWQAIGEVSGNVTTFTFHDGFDDFYRQQNSPRPTGPCKFMVTADDVFNRQESTDYEFVIE